MTGKNKWVWNDDDDDEEEEEEEECNKDVDDANHNNYMSGNYTT